LTSIIVPAADLGNIIFGFTWRVSLVLPPAHIRIRILILIAILLDAQIGVRVAHILQQSIVLLADEALLVMACHIVPVYAIVVELIQQGETILWRSILLVLAVVRLGQANASGGRPIALVPLSGWCQFLQCGGPEPTVDVCGLQIGAVTALEVTQAAAGPDVFHLQRESSVLINVLKPGQNSNIHPRKLNQ